MPLASMFKSQKAYCVWLSHLSYAFGLKEKGRKGVQYYQEYLLFVLDET